MKRTKSSAQWLKDHFSDPYVILAQKAGYRSRAVYKLKEVNEKEKLVNNTNVINVPKESVVQLIEDNVNGSS